MRQEISGILLAVSKPNPPPLGRTRPGMVAPFLNK